MRSACHVTSFPNFGRRRRIGADPQANGDFVEQDHENLGARRRTRGRNRVRESVATVISLCLYAFCRDDRRAGDGEVATVAAAPVSVNDIRARDAERTDDQDDYDGASGFPVFAHDPTLSFCRPAARRFPTVRSARRQRSGARAPADVASAIGSLGRKTRRAPLTEAEDRSGRGRNFVLKWRRGSHLSLRPETCGYVQKISSFFNDLIDTRVR
jgi:hypothetical protein